jgi:hypothetical protein
MLANPADLYTPTLPKDCGLAIALPLTEEEFRLDFTENRADHDYAPRRAEEQNWQTFWKQRIKPIAEVASSLVAIAQDLGIEVRESATLNDLTELFNSRSVVTIIAHWRGHHLYPEDLLVSPQELISKIQHNYDEISFALRSRMDASKLSAIESNIDPEQSAKQLLDLLNKAIELPPLLQHAQTYSNVTVFFDDVELPAANRELLDLWGGTALKPGNRLELRDGLHAVSDIERQIPSQFAGIIHFGICHSTVLGNRIRQNYPNRRAIMSPRLVQPIPQLLILEFLYQQLLTEPYNYGQLLSQIYTQLLSRS